MYTKHSDMSGDSRGSGSGSDAAAVDVHPDGGRTSLDATLHALADQRRRYALYYLQDCTTATLREIARQVASWESDRPVEPAEPGPDDRVYADFYHRHLPKLTEANLVEYDPREELVRYDCPDVVEHVLELARLVESPGQGSG